MHLAPPDVILTLLGFASQISGYSIPTDVPAPKVELMTHKEMSDKYCSNINPESKRLKDCDIYGQYGDDEVIQIDQERISTDGLLHVESVVVHELTHWLQQHHGKGGFTCGRVAFREREAYGVQREFVEKYEQGKFFLRTPQFDCAEE